MGQFSQKQPKKQSLTASLQTLQLTFHRFRHRACELADIVLSGVEGTHPSHNRFFFHPGIEKVMLPSLFDGVAGNLDEDAVGPTPSKQL